MAGTSDQICISCLTPKSSTIQAYGRGPSCTPFLCFKSRTNLALAVHLATLVSVFIEAPSQLIASIRALVAYRFYMAAVNRPILSEYTVINMLIVSTCSALSRPIVQVVHFRGIVNTNSEVNIHIASTCGSVNRPAICTCSAITVSSLLHAGNSQKNPKLTVLKY